MIADTVDLAETMLDMGRRARAASRKLGQMTPADRTRGLQAVAAAIRASASKVLAANAQDRMILPGANWATMQDETEGGHRFGNPEAKVKLVEFMSYTCSLCATFARQGDSAIRLAYVPTGRISYEIRHLIRDPKPLFRHLHPIRHAILRPKQIPDLNFHLSSFPKCSSIAPSSRGALLRYYAVRARHEISDELCTLGAQF